ncbi:MAG: HAD hydrolase family protein [Mogibacterium sp.]|nr:HAD hydrolase family protein [Mogibacterium sp.]
MANAWGGTKDYADFITDSNDEDGVAKAIERFVLKRPYIMDAGDNCIL